MSLVIFLKDIILLWEQNINREHCSSFLGNTNKKEKGRREKGIEGEKEGKREGRKEGREEREKEGRMKRREGGREGGNKEKSYFS